MTVTCKVTEKIKIKRHLKQGAGARVVKALSHFVAARTYTVTFNLRGNLLWREALAPKNYTTTDVPVLSVNLVTY